jgi:hypothetical protein
MFNVLLSGELNHFAKIMAVDLYENCLLYHLYAVNADTE